MFHPKSRVDPPLLLLLFALCAGGAFLRLLDLGFPEHLTWDEHHFINNARNYLRGAADWNDHPPLGKLLMALSAHFLGDSFFAFRLPSAVLGLLAMLSAWGLARRVFGDERAGLLAAAFLSVDGFFIAYSRTALLDGMLCSLSLSALWIMTFRGPLPILLVATLVGTGMAIKMSMIALLGPLVALAFARAAWLSKTIQKRCGTLRLFGSALPGSHAELGAYALALPIAASVYLVWWTLGLDLAQQPHSLADAIEATRKMMVHHAGLTDWKHPLLSRWWTWFLPTEPILLRRDVTETGMIRAMTSMGNPLVWWATDLALLSVALAALQSLRRKRLALLTGPFWLLLGFVAFLSPWILTNRDSYIYHYLPSYGIGIVVLAGTLSRWARTPARQLSLLGFVCAVACVAAFYAPVWAQLPLSETALSWRPLIQGL